MPAQLNVNIDHVATLRQARRAPYPDPVEAARLAEDAGAGSEVSLFVDPDPRQIGAIGAISDTAARGSKAISGFEINTDAYTRAKDIVEHERELHKVAEAAELGRAQGLRLYAGHGLRTDNVGPIAALPGMEELNIGHFLIARAVMVGMETAVKEMLAAMG
jgi:pyridoxine 5-phosphate synthase